MKMHLGKVYKDGKMINHRSLLKILLNPLLRKFLGIQIATKFNIKTNEIGSPIIMKCKVGKIKWCIFSYDRDFDLIKKERRLI